MKSDIFFFVATIATIVLVVLLCVAIVYLIKFLRKANKISDTVQDDIHKIEERIKDQPWLNFLFKKRNKKKTKSTLDK